MRGQKEEFVGYRGTEEERGDERDKNKFVESSGTGEERDKKGFVGSER